MSCPPLEFRAQTHATSESSQDTGATSKSRTVCPNAGRPAVPGHRYGGRTRPGSRCSPPRRGPVRLPAVAWIAPGLYCTKVGRYWRRGGGTPGGWGLRAVRTTLGQWIPTLVEWATLRRRRPGPVFHRLLRAPQGRSRRRPGRGKVRLVPEVKVPGFAATTLRSRSRRQPSVHRADINEPAVEAPPEGR